jgi:hypothetical protein
MNIDKLKKLEKVEKDSNCVYIFKICESLKPPPKEFRDRPNEYQN